MCRYRLVTFDVTGTLLKFRKSVGEQYVESGKKFGFILNPNEVQDHFVNHYTRLDKKYPNFGYNSIGWKTWWKEVVANSFRESYNGQLKGIDIDNVFNDLINSYSNNTSWEIASGAKDLLDSLQAKNVTLGVISNFDIRLHGLLREMNLYGYFKFVLTSYECGYVKPNKKIFHLAEKLASTDRPEEIIHIGDSIDLDYKGARNAGWNSILLTKNQSHIDPNYFSNLTSIKEYLIKDCLLKS